jgi:hypothetical protein
LYTAGPIALKDYEPCTTASSPGTESVADRVACAAGIRAYADTGVIWLVLVHVAAAAIAAEVQTGSN